VLGWVHFRADEHRQAISCYRKALALTRQRNGPQARLLLADLLTSFGDACLAAGDQSAAVGSWLQARQILDDLRSPDNLRVRLRLESATAPGA
jgi:tetratricopeptide (TPR) repeat protein